MKVDVVNNVEDVLSSTLLLCLFVGSSNTFVSTKQTFLGERDMVLCTVIGPLSLFHTALVFSGVHHRAGLRTVQGRQRPEASATTFGTGC